MKRMLALGAMIAVALVANASEATPPPDFRIGPTTVNFATSVDSYQYQTVTIMTGNHPLVIANPGTFSGDIGPRADGGSIFWNTQAGSCWQQYEVFGNAIPAHSTCTIQVGFYPDAVKTYNATMTVTRCTHWTTDPTWGFVVCTSFGSSENVSLVGEGL